MYSILGISGVARVGKDTLFTCIKEINKEINFTRMAFADELKRESDEFLMKNVGISAFTEDENEKDNKTFFSDLWNSCKKEA